MKSVVAIIGRPNVGKSSLFNRLSHQRKAIVIDQPGATRDRNYAECTWNDKAYLLIDTGGFEPAATEGILVQMREQTQLAIEEAESLTSGKTLREVVLEKKWLTNKEFDKLVKIS